MDFEFPKYLLSPADDVCNLISLITDTKAKY
jgi:hypothetical protein